MKRATNPGYSPTRLSGNPLESRSIIDYIIVSRGLAGDEVSTAQATVHSQLVGTSTADHERFRGQASDHIPVTVEVRVVADSDS